MIACLKWGVPFPIIHSLTGGSALILQRWVAKPAESRSTY
jgi:hypothetical protein